MTLNWPGSVGFSYSHYARVDPCNYIAVIVDVSTVDPVKMVLAPKHDKHMDICLCAPYQYCHFATDHMDCV